MHQRQVERQLVKTALEQHIKLRLGLGGVKRRGVGGRANAQELVRKNIGCELAMDHSSASHSQS